MSIPGEIPQEIGRAYKQIFVGCLEHTVREFRRTFEVEEVPEKLSFQGPSGANFSFDILGVYRHPAKHCEVYVESKGHKDGSKVLDGYREFLAKSYATMVGYERNKGDLFWYVTNVPFGTSFGRMLTSPEFIIDAFTITVNDSVKSILGSAPIDKGHIHSLSERVAVCVFTDSFIRVTGVLYMVKPGDNVWSIIKFLHADRIPTLSFQPLANVVGRLNGLEDVNKILPGRRLQIPWYGIQWD
jgi:hypothetical protein